MYFINMYINVTAAKNDLDFVSLFTVDTQEEDSHLVATLLPKTSTFLPRVPHRKLDYFYPYECFRLACEQLFGHVPCYVQYSENVPSREFSDETEDMVVTQVLAIVVTQVLVMVVTQVLVIVVTQVLVLAFT